MGEHYTVLVVDDDESIRQALQAALEMEGYTVYLAGDGREALAIADRDPPDLVLCDYAMPGMTGIAMLQRMLDICPDAIRFLITGQADLEVAMAAINEGGVYKFIQKPWNLRDLLVMVRRALEHYELVREGKVLMEMLEMENRERQVQVRGLRDQVARYRKMLGMD